MAEQFHLGFDIDTKPLANAKTAAMDAAQAIGKLGDAEQALGQKSALAIDQQKKLEDAIKKTQQAAAQNQGAQQFADGIGKMTGAMGTASSAAAQMNGVLGSGGGGGGLGSAIELATGGFGRMASAVGPLGLMLGATAIAAGFVGKQVFDAASALAKFGDDAALMEARLKNALGSTFAARDAMKSLYAATQETGTGFTVAADSFLRLARNSEALGATRAEIQTLSETIQKLGLISGAGRGEIASGMMQLSQALASGRLNGDELRSIMENMPALAKAIADGLGKSVGEMRAMGAAGELTGSKVFASILSQADKVNLEFKTLPNTAEREFQKVGDAYSRLLSDIAKKTNSSEFVQSIAKSIGAAIESARERINGPGGIGLEIIGRTGPVPRIGAMLFQSQTLRDQANDPVEQQRRRDEALKNLRTMENDTLAEDMLKANKPILDASSIAKDLDDRTSKIITLTANIKSLQAGITALQSRPTLTETDTKQLEQFNRTLIIAKKQLEETRNPVDALAQDFAKLTAAIAQGGGGGATGLIQQAQKQNEAMQKMGLAGGGSLDTLIRQEVMRGGDQIRTLEMQTKNQQGLTGAIGGTREQTRELEISNDLLLKRFQMFGDLERPVIDGFFDRLTISMREQKKAADAAAAAQANYSNTLEASISNGQAALTGQGFEQRRFAAEARAREADRQRPGTFKSEMAKFNANENLSGVNQITQMQQSTELQRLLSGNFANDREMQKAQLAFNTRQATAGMAPGQRMAYSIEAGANDEAQFNAARASEERALQRQIGSSQRRGGLIGLPPEELRVQTAILEKQQQLEQMGLQAGQAQYDNQIRLTEELARQNIAYDKQRATIESINGSVDGLASGIKNNITDSFLEAFKTGEVDAKRFFGSIGDMAIRAGAEMTYEIAIKPLMALAVNAAKMGLTNYLFNGGMTAQTGTLTGGTGNAAGISYQAANGAAFNGGGLQAFAKGGTFTNSIVSNPTLFKFANGGSLGLMGEAGPEAIMPLRRGPDGRLGVSGGSGGGDVQIIVNDMRSGKDSAPVEATSTQGPGGFRQVQIMVRDEIRRSMAAGEFDRTMQANFGSTRQIARK